MKTFELKLKEMNLIEMNNELLRETDGGFLFLLGVGAKIFWKGVGLGIACGTAGAAVALSS